jgi:hypothetical protein
MEKPNLIIYGRVIALSAVEEIASKEAGKPAMKKRQIYLDCTKTDSITHEIIGVENKPLLELGGEKLLDKVAALNLQKDDVVGIRFAIQGNPYKDQQTGKTKVFTAIRCYDIEVVRKAGQSVVQPHQPAPVQQPEPQPQVQQPQTQADVVAEQSKEPLPF